MPKYRFDKLVRDKLPKLLIDEGYECHFETLDSDEYIHELQRKLIEELEEIVDAKNREELIEEIADLQDTFEAFCKAHKVSKDEIEAARAKKFARRGAFETRQYMHYIAVSKDDEWNEYFVNRPEKYPLVEDV